MAIFKDAGHALHFAYVIEAYASSPVSQMEIIMRQLMKEIAGVVPVGSNGRIDFGGLTTAEMYNQCTDIRNVVRRILRPFDAMLLEARYSTDPIVKRDAIRHISEFCRPMLELGREVSLCLTWRHYQANERKDTEWSFRDIQREYGIHKDKAARRARKLSEMIQSMECKAIDNLRDHFEQAGITER